MLSRAVPEPLAIVLDVLAALCALVWAFVAWRALKGLRSLPPLEPLDGAAEGRIAAIVAARDDGEAVERAVADLLAQRGVPGLRVIAVDDRSSDDTVSRLGRTAGAAAHFRLVRIDALPHGWLGKPHACQRGADAAGPDADWLLFLDADVRLGADAVARALRTAQRTGAAHVCLVPQLDDQTLPGRAASLTLTIGLAQQACGVEADRARAYFGVGAFTLIRRDAYRAIGGHEALRMTVLEDVAIARRVRAAGYRTRLRFAVDVFSVRWITSFGSVFRLLEKNYFALLHYDVGRCAVACVAGTGVWAMALLGPVVAPPVGWLAFAALLALALPAWGLARRYRWPRALAVCVPLLVPIAFLALARSAWVTLRRGGVMWRETFYPLAELRAAEQEERRGRDGLRAPTARAKHARAR